MKKAICLLIISNLLFNALQVRASQINWEELDRYSKPLYSSLNESEFVYEVKGNFYYHNSSSHYTLPVKYDPVLFNALEPDPKIEYIWTGKYYFVRDTNMDNIWLDSSDFYILPIKFYDANMNLVEEHLFEQHVEEIGFLNGEFYCKLHPNWRKNLPERIVKSSDMTNWTETSQSIPHPIGNIVFSENQVSLDKLYMLTITYEKIKSLKFYSTFGEWIVKIDENNNYYLSNDNVYFVKIDYPSDLKELDKDYDLKYQLQRIYEYQDNIIIELYRENSYLTTSINNEDLENLKPRLKKLVRLTVPKQPIYDELERLKNAPYVKVADEILGFETAPIMEEDRTLVPMRFLFEKLGAEVTWDQATMTATAQKENTTINFSINQTNAVVNGTNEQMDVPARLVNDKTMVPLRFLSEELGYEVDWNQELRMATIDTNTGDTETANETGIALFFKNIGQTIAGWFNA